MQYPCLCGGGGGGDGGDGGGGAGQYCLTFVLVREISLSESNLEPSALITVWLHLK